VNAAAALCLLLLQGPPVFESGVETVHVDVSVTRGQEPVRRLTVEDFEVRDNGVRQDVRLVDSATVPLEIVLALDVSSSLDKTELGHLRDAAVQFASGLKKGDDVELLGFSHILRVATPTAGAVPALRTGGQTSLYDAIYAGLMMARGPRRSILVLFTDGKDNTSWLGAEQVLRVAGELETVVYVLSLAEYGPMDSRGSVEPADPLSNRNTVPNDPESTHERALGRLATSTGGQVWDLATAADLGPRFAEILEALRARYLLAYEPAGVARGGEHKLQVKLRRGKGEVRARTSYTVTSP
jgi:VWFA-related protein